MRTRRFIAALATVVACTVTPSIGAGTAVAGAATSGEGVEYIVALRDGADSGALAGKLGGHAFRHTFNGVAARLSESEAKALRARPDVVNVRPGRRFKATAAAPPCTDVTKCQITTRSIRRIDADLSSATSGEGRGRVHVNVAVIDSGVDDHTDLVVRRGADCVPGSRADTRDPHGHGTGVASIVGALDNRKFIAGVAPGAKIHSVRVLDKNLDADESWVLCGLEWVASTHTDLNPFNDVEVVNMSLGAPTDGPGDDGACGGTNGDAVHRAVCALTAMGIVVVAGAGNDTSDLGHFIPAAYGEVLAVTAMQDQDGEPGALTPSHACGTGDDIPAPFSNFVGPDADPAHVVAAPGWCISMLYGQNSVQVGRGTSYAAPHAAGVVALCLEYGPCRKMDPRQIVNHIVTAARNWNQTHPSYGFAGDPLHTPDPARGYGHLVRAARY